VPRNVEIKARLRNPGAVREAAARLAGGSEHLLEQEDTFFFSPRGRLKLRTFAGGRGELIAYERPDAAGPKTSSYEIVPVEDPPRMKAALAAALGVRGVVRKRRTLLLAGRTRIHLDEVEGLGDFLELEVVLREGEEPAAGEAEAERLLEALGVPGEERVSGAYLDLLGGGPP